GTGVAAPKPIPSAPTVTVVNNCSNSVLTAGLFTGSLLWSNGATSSFISVTAGGTYGVTQTVDGCTSAPGTGIAQPLNVSIPTPAVSVANNCGNSVLTASGFTGSLLWSNGATTTSITVTVPGAYTVMQTVNGCNSASGGGVAAPKVIPALSSSLALTTTSGTSFEYTPASSTGGTLFTWSRAAVSGISNVVAAGTGNIAETLVNTTSSPVNVTYVYTLTANGCVNTQNLVVTVNPVSTVNCMINGSITSSFTSTTIPAGRFIWFNSVLDRGSFSGITGTVIFTITNGKITFTANSQQYTLNVPNATLQFDAAVTSASTQFVNNAWQTVVPRGYTNFAFLSGLSYQVPSNLPGNISNVKWTADISINKTGITPAWKWGAAVYTSFGGHAGLNIKPINGSTQNPYPNNDKAGTPENFKTSLVSGAKGSGGTNYTGNYSGTSSTTCTATSGQRSAGDLSVTIIEDIIEEKGDFEVIAIPNPSNTYFNVIISSNNENPVTVKVFDILGQVMDRYEKIASNSRLSIGHNWTSGYYFIEVMQDDKRKFLKVIKTN
ncbi:MAG: T9SS type A sorting domain-containing protein, partial [Chitinophagaceae bacterium]